MNNEEHLLAQIGTGFGSMGYGVIYEDLHSFAGLIVNQLW